MNYLQQLNSLGNIYWALRHGKSLANDEGLIVSHPDQGVSQYGLSKEGRRQVASAVAAAMRDLVLDRTTLIVTSDFARARESAEIVRDLLGTRDIIVTPNLRERFFGTWDGQHFSNYGNVWADDALDGAHKHNGVESTEEVLARTTSLILELERDFYGRNIVLVSHGDVLQILQTAFQRIGSGSHRLIPHLDTGQLRRLELKAIHSDE
ncbi:MAG TPA: histidine phosphatase family protein [Chloroflexia bacterium]|jgi:probable phosphoglycerate mutase